MSQHCIFLPQVVDIYANIFRAPFWGLLPVAAFGLSVQALKQKTSLLEEKSCDVTSEVGGDSL